MRNRKHDKRHFNVGSFGDNVGNLSIKDSLSSLANEFSVLKGELSRLELLAADIFNESTWTVTREAEWLRIMDPIRQRMMEIAMGMSEIGSTSQSDIIEKSRALLEFTQHDQDDNLYVLASSLCRDIHALLKTGN